VCVTETGFECVIHIRYVYQTHTGIFQRVYLKQNFDAFEWSHGCVFAFVKSVTCTNFVELRVQKYMDLRISKKEKDLFWLGSPPLLYTCVCERKIVDI